MTPAPAPWPDQARTLIRRRFARLAAADSFHPEPRASALAAGCPASWYDALPPRAAGVFSGCGWPAGNLVRRDVRTVIDLGCGGGLDARWMAERLGRGALVLALDLTPEMLARARETVAGAGRVGFVAADMERLPLDGGCADAVVANASLNLATDKDAAFGEILRALRPGGRLLAADLVRAAPLPREILDDPMAMAASLGGVIEEPELRGALERAGFADIRIGGHRPFGPVIAVDIEAARRRG